MKSPQRQRPRQPQVLGAALLITVILLVVVLKAIPQPGRDPATTTPFTTATASAPTAASTNLTLVTGYGGGLKANFFADTEVKRILADKYGLEVNLIVKGSIQAMCQAGLNQVDFLWVGDQSSLSIYTNQCGDTMLGWTNIYNSPLVFYSWTPVVDALAAVGVVTRSGTVYMVDTKALVDLVVQGRTWASIGLPGFTGPIQIHTTDPQLSNSGFLFAGLLACVLNGDQPPTLQTVGPLLPKIEAIFQNQGYMTANSAMFFNQFLSQGSGANPIAAGYESQLLEYLIQNPGAAPQVAADVRMLYPRPTVWASHPFIARTAGGMRLMNALKDPSIQQLALTHHGNRPGVPLPQSNATPTAFSGYLSTITSVCSMPASDVMKVIIYAIASPAPSTSGTPTIAANEALIAGDDPG